MSIENAVLPPPLIFPLLLSEYDITLFLGCTLNDLEDDEETAKREISKDLEAYYKDQEMIVSLQPAKLLQIALLRRQNNDNTEYNLYYLEKENQINKDVHYPYNIFGKIIDNGASFSPAKKDYYYKDWYGGATSQMAQRGIFYLETAKEIVGEMVNMPREYLKNANSNKSTINIVEMK